ncbi:MAG: hypothetical protein ACRDRT_05895 [Pseudonocardiaceae bacterium]
MTTSKARLEERIESADLLSTRLKIILADIETAVSYAEKSGHTSVIGEVTGLRKHVRSAHRQAVNVRKRLGQRSAVAEVMSHG